MNRFFFMEQDIGIVDCISLEDFDIRGVRKAFDPEDAAKINDVTVLYLKNNSGETAQDFFRNPVNMITERTKRVFAMYEPTIIFKKIVMINKKKQSQLVYYLPLIYKVDALADCIERYPNGQEKKIILDHGKIGEHKIFLLKNSMVKKIIVKIDVVESLLRRKLLGVTFQEIEVI